MKYHETVETMGNTGEKIGLFVYKIVSKITYKTIAAFFVTLFGAAAIITGLFIGLRGKK